MNRKEIEKVVVRAVAAATNVSPKEIHPQDALVYHGIDSLKAITILYGLEEHFNFRIENDEIENIKSVDDITDALCKLLLRGDDCEN